MFSLQQNQRTRGQNRFWPEDGGKAGGQRNGTMYTTHVSTCKNNRIKEEKKNTC
jgi:hypothetical protein